MTLTCIDVDEEHADRRVKKRLCGFEANDEIVELRKRSGHATSGGEAKGEWIQSLISVVLLRQPENCAARRLRKSARCRKTGAPFNRIVGGSVFAGWPLD